MNETQKHLIESILLYASTVSVQDAMDGNFEMDDEGRTYDEVMSDKEFEQVADYIRGLMDLA